MKNLLLFFGCLLTLLGCNQKRNSTKIMSAQDSIKYNLLEEFCKDIIPCEKERSMAIDTFMNLRYIYMIKFDTLINGYDIKIIAQIPGVTYDAGLAYGGDYQETICKLFFQKNGRISNLCDFFIISDSLINTFEEMKINEISYPLQTNDKFDKVKLGKFKDYPFLFFLDTDFDGQKELITSIPLFGQRWLNVYFPFKLNGDVWEYDTIYNDIQRKYEYIYGMLDDWVEFDYENNELLSYLSCGYCGNRTMIFKVENRLPRLIRREFYYCLWDSLGKRVIYNGNDSIVTYYNDGEKYEDCY